MISLKKVSIWSIVLFTLLSFSCLLSLPTYAQTTAEGTAGLYMKGKDSRDGQTGADGDVNWTTPTDTENITNQTNDQNTVYVTSPGGAYPNQKLPETGSVNLYLLLLIGASGFFFALYALQRYRSEYKKRKEEPYASK